MTGKRGTPLERFERFYIPEPNSGCWLWIGCVHPHTGYGSLEMPGGKPVRAHILSHALFNSAVPKGLDVRHLCGVRCCVNPEHLKLGTRAENMNDCRVHGTLAKGFKISNTKLSEAQVAAIRNDKRTHREIAQTYSINSSYVSMIKAGKRR